MTLNALQIILLALGLLLLLSTWYAVARGRASLAEGFRWSLLWTALCVFAVKPSLSNKMAKAIGIDSGRFLVLYVSVIVLFVCLVMVYARTRRLSREITLLVREIAIHRGNDLAERNPQGPVKSGKGSNDADQAS